MARLQRKQSKRAGSVTPQLEALTPESREGLLSLSLAGVTARRRRMADYGRYVRTQRMRKVAAAVSPSMLPAEPPDADHDDGIITPTQTSPTGRKRPSRTGYVSPYSSPRSASKGGTLLDWSFLKISGVEGLSRVPLPGRRRHEAPLTSPEEEGGALDEETLRRRDEVPPLPEAGAAERVGQRAAHVRLSHNQFSICDGLTQTLVRMLSPARYLVSLDLSCNQIRTLPADLCTQARSGRGDGPGVADEGAPREGELLLPHLRALYLHSNELRGETEILKLAPLGNTPGGGLRILTLHGNSGLLAARYRPLCVSLFPRLRSLDFSAVTPGDRDVGRSGGGTIQHASPSPTRRKLLS
eukprot:Hpha_TRINITY_DN30065_c0_g1::TRINITY_DN30065_c0_g1_i1::g.21592::m.21592